MIAPAPGNWQGTDHRSGRDGSPGRAVFAHTCASRKQMLTICPPHFHRLAPCTRSSRRKAAPRRWPMCRGFASFPSLVPVVQYRHVHELYRHGGRIQDIGLAVVVEGRFASSVRAMDLGSAEVKYLNLASELVILDWVYDPTLTHLRTLAASGNDGEGTGDTRPSGELRRYCFDLALRVLGRRGFSPLTRPTLLRIGFSRRLQGSGSAREHGGADRHGSRRSDSCVTRL